jgi:pimeloyl-ACP methyl ester carboxylesterase
MAALALAVAACTSSGAASGPAPTAASAPAAAGAPALDEVVCPTDVTAEIVTKVSCGYVTVPEDRADPDGAEVRLFVARVQPPGEDPEPEPMLVVGTEIGTQANYGGIAPLAQRVNREVIFLDHRGSGHSEPLLACPELEELHPEILARPWSRLAARSLVVDAAAACATRLRAAGVNLDAYGIEAIVEDVEDVRVALGVDRWNLFSLGPTSLFHFATLRAHPDSVRAVVLDSPTFPQLDAVATPIGRVRESLDAVAAACAEDAACSGAYGDLHDLLRRAFERPGTGEGTADGVRVAVDDVTGVRALADSFGTEEEIAGIPFGIAASLAASTESNDAIAGWMLFGSALCVGYLVDCDKALAHGAHLSVLCRNRAPFVGEDSTAAAAEEPWLVRTFAPSPMLAACEGWDVEPGDPALAEPVRTDVPILVLVGQFAAPDAARASVDGLPNAWVVEVPAWGRNVLGSGDCALAIRNAWVADPTVPPETSCLDAIAPIEFATN